MTKGPHKQLKVEDIMRTLPGWAVIERSQQCKEPQNDFVLTLAQPWFKFIKLFTTKENKNADV